LHILLTRKMGKIDAQPSREVSARPGTQRGRQPFACRFHRPVGSPGSTRAKCSAGPSTSMISISRGCRWRGGPAEMRAPRARCRCAARRSFHARNSWIGGRALPSHKSRAGNNRHDERGSIGEAAHAVPGAFEMCFRNAWFRNAPLRPVSAIRVDADGDGGRAGATTVALVSAGRSSSTAEAVSRCGQSDGNARTRNNREGTMPPASAGPDGASRATTARRVACWIGQFRA